LPGSLAGLRPLFTLIQNDVSFLLPLWRHGLRIQRHDHITQRDEGKRVVVKIFQCTPGPCRRIREHIEKLFLIV
jgi:hypothetical protein